MADLIENEPRPGELQIVLGAQRPFDASDVANILSALSSDYRAAYPGRRLIVTDLRTGSMLLTVIDGLREVAPYAKDAATIAKGGKAIYEFGKLLRDGFTGKKGQAVPTKHPDPMLPHKSIENIARIAAQAGSDLLIKQKGVDGQTMELRLSPPEVRKVDLYVKEEKRLRKAEVPDLARVPAIEHRTRYALLTDRLADARPSDVATVIQAVVLAISARQRTTVLANLIDALQQQGRHDIAELVLKEAKTLGTHI